MTPLLGTKTPSAPVEDKSGGNRRAARAAVFQVFTKHETRGTKHGFYAFHETRITDFTAARSLLSCALWRGMGRLWRGMGGRRPPHRQHGLLGFHETRITRHGFYAFLPTISHDFPVFPGPPHPPGQGTARRSLRQHGRSGFYETRITNHGLYGPSVRRGCAVRRKSGAKDG